MEAIISNLVRSFEQGRMSRRDLVQGLAVLAAGASAPAAAQAPTGLQGVRIDHVSIQTSNLERSVAFYERVFGFKVVSESKENQLKLMGVTKPLVSLHQKPPFGIIDHFQISVADFNKDSVGSKLKGMGIEPRENFDYGFHFVDPEGINVQLERDRG